MLEADPTFTQYDEAIVKNLKLNYKVVFAGSETADPGFKKAEKNKTSLLGYF